MTWTTERVSQLKTLAIIARYTARQISDRMGVTRNAVIGKLGRLGVQLANPPTKPRPEKPAPTDNHFTRPMHQRVKVRAGSNQHRKQIQIIPATEIIDLPPDASSFACTIAGLGPVFGMDQCRWPVDEMPSADMRYCGAASNGPWCQRHRRIAYKPLVRRA